MLNFIVRRLMAAVVALFLLSIATFTLLRVMPGDDVICPGFCSRAELEARRHEYGFDKPLFPVSFTGDAIWLLAVPAVGAGAYVAWRGARRTRGSAVADYALPRLAWNATLMAFLTTALIALASKAEPLVFTAHGAITIPRPATDGAWLLVLPAAALLATLAAATLTRPRLVAIPRAD